MREPIGISSAKSATGSVLIPLIRAAATIGFAVVPCSLGFVIIAVSEQLIRSILVGEEPELLMSELQNQFPSAAFELIERDDSGLVKKVVELIEHTEQPIALPVDVLNSGFEEKVWKALQYSPAGSCTNYTFLAEQLTYAPASKQLADCREDYCTGW